MKDTIYFKCFMDSLRDDQKHDYRQMSINQQKDWYISYLESHYTVCTDDGIDNEKLDQINYIQKVLTEWGGITAGELELDASPCINSAGNSRKKLFELIESFNVDGVTAVTYHDEIELNESEYNYEDLSEEIIEEIFMIMEDYEAEQLRTKKRISN